MKRRINDTRWTMFGAIGAAVAASLCCILPVVAAALGLAGFAASAVFAAWRPYLLALTFTLLGLGFYLSYLPRAQACEPDSLCAQPRFARSSRAALWIVAALVVVLAAFPYYSGTLVRAFGRERRDPQPGDVLAAHAVLSIQGMDCTACAALLEKDLGKIQGVRTAKVSFQKKVAIVNYDSRVVSPERFVQTVEKDGYKGAIVAGQNEN